MKFTKIGTIEATAFIVIIILNHLVLNLPKSILESCGSSSLLNVIYITILIFLFLFIIFKLFKNFINSDIIDVSNFLGGKWLRSIIGILYITFFITTSCSLLRNFSEMLILTYFEKVSISFIIICFLFVAVISNKFGPNTVIRCNLIIFPLSLISLLITFFAIRSRIMPQKIFPLFGNGINETFFSGISNIFAFSGISYIYFLMPLLKNQKNFNKIGYAGIGISALYLFLSIGSLLLSLSDLLVHSQLSPMYLLIRAARFGSFFQRPDALFFFIWILSFMSYLSTILFIINTIFKKISNINSMEPMIYCFSAIMFVVALIPSNMSQIRFMEDIIFKYFTITLVFIISFIILILANIKYRRVKGSSSVKGEHNV